MAPSETWKAWSPPHFAGGGWHGDDRGHPRDDEPGQRSRAERNQAGGGGDADELCGLRQERPGDGTDEGGGRLAGEKYGADPAEDRVRDHALHGGLRDHLGHGAEHADGYRGRQRGGER